MNEVERLTERLLRTLEEPVAAAPRFKADLRKKLLVRVRQYGGVQVSANGTAAARPAGCVLLRLYQEKLPGPGFTKRYPLCAICPMRAAGNRGLSFGLNGCLYTAPQHL
ncbi:MAG: hypothetical protein Q7R39_08635 [Dehalococcoidia bacterium]|nr:hypothetical protein [Dehalococcoidia bacterium]